MNIKQKVKFSLIGMVYARVNMKYPHRDKEFSLAAKNVRFIKISSKSRESFCVYSPALREDTLPPYSLRPTVKFHDT